MRRTFIAAVVLTLISGALAVIAGAQEGDCVQGDPIPECEAGGLSEYGYVFGGAAVVFAGVAVVLGAALVARRSTNRGER